MSVPSLLTLCAEVIAEHSFGLERVEKIPDDVVVAIAEKCKGEQLVFVDRLGANSAKNKITADWKRVFKQEESECNSEDQLAIIKRVKTYGYDRSNSNFWKQMFLTLLFEKELDHSNTETFDMELIDEFVEICRPSIQYVTLNYAKLNILKHVISFPQLKYLDLTRSRRSFKPKSEGLEIIAPILKQKDCNIHTLKLNNCNIGNRGTELLLEALQTNESLLVLELRWNDLDNNQTEALGNALKQHPKLSILDLRKNFMTMNGRQTLRRIQSEVKQYRVARISLV
eukprot:gb/GECH01007907.1/.p1 GENE.gb/GECH01007907.1/~~gb/GECH01007907.1/.p1  ORF type:complete len:284 (+),score=72.43 gb/GECH01007907.1/:1-852(+)